MHILVTGGAGYIGSHTCLQLLQRGDSVTVFDNLANSSPASLDRVAALAGQPINFVKGDIRDAAALAALFGVLCPSKFRDHHAPTSQFHLEHL